MLQVSPGAIAYAGYGALTRLAMDLGRCAPPMPVVVHLDHCREPEVVARAIDDGFDSVMFDGSRLAARREHRRHPRLVALARRRDGDRGRGRAGRHRRQRGHRPWHGRVRHRTARRRLPRSWRRPTSTSSRRRLGNLHRMPDDSSRAGPRAGAAHRRGHAPSDRAARRLGHRARAAPGPGRRGHRQGQHLVTGEPGAGGGASAELGSRRRHRRPSPLPRRRPEPDQGRWQTSTSELTGSAGRAAGAARPPIGGLVGSARAGRRVTVTCVVNLGLKSMRAASSTRRAAAGDRLPPDRDPDGRGLAWSRIPEDWWRRRSRRSTRSLADRQLARGVGRITSPRLLAASCRSTGDGRRGAPARS